MNTRPVVRIVIAYEQFVAAVYAKQMVDRLTAEFRGEFEVCSDVWKFELIGYSSLVSQATDAVTDADVVIIAADGDLDLPAPVKTWIKFWASQQGDHRRTLVALLVHDPEPLNEPLRLQLILQQVAAEGGKEFFFHYKDSSYQTLCSAMGSIHRNADLVFAREYSRSAELPAARYS